MTTQAYTLNIGLLTADGREIESIVGGALECDLHPVEFEVHGSTLVLAVLPERFGSSVFEQAVRLCRKCGRDAVAVFDPWRNTGYVLGDRSLKYGPFDPAKFRFLSPAPVLH